MAAPDQRFPEMTLGLLQGITEAILLIRQIAENPETTHLDVGERIEQVHRLVPHAAHRAILLDEINALLPPATMDLLDPMEYARARLAGSIHADDIT